MARAGFQLFFRKTTLLATHIKKLETYFAVLYFWTFAQCDKGCSSFNFNLCLSLMFTITYSFFLGDIFSLFDMEQLTPNTVTQLLHKLQGTIHILRNHF